MFEEFMSVVKEAEEESGVAFANFTEEEFVYLQENCHEEMFSDAQVQAKLRECACVKSVVVDEEEGFITVELNDGCIGEFPIY